MSSNDNPEHVMNGKTDFSFRIEFGIQCSGCEMPLPLDGPQEKAHCNSCQSDNDIPRSYLIEALANSCRKCGMAHPVKYPPEWLTSEVPRIVTLVNAMFNVDTANGKDIEGIKMEPLSCPSCAALLEVDGSTRMVECSYCGGNVYLPDARWLRFNAGKRKTRWFINCEYTDEE